MRWVRPLLLRCRRSRARTPFASTPSPPAPSRPPEPQPRSAIPFPLLRFVDLLVYPRPIAIFGGLPRFALLAVGRVADAGRLRRGGTLPAVVGHGSLRTWFQPLPCAMSQIGCLETP